MTFHIADNRASLDNHDMAHLYTVTQRMALDWLHCIGIALGGKEGTGKAGERINCLKLELELGISWRSCTHTYIIRA
jgi:hypothetical protein